MLYIPFWIISWKKGNEMFKVLPSTFKTVYAFVYVGIDDVLYTSHDRHKNNDTISGWYELLYSPPPLTLWFFAMMIVFYFITPILLHKLHIFDNNCDRRIFLIRATIFYACLVMLNLLFPTDYRILIYYPLYIYGISFPISKLDTVEHKWYMLLPFASFLLLIGYKSNVYVISELLQACGVLYFILLISSILEKIKINGFTYVVKVISYISMTAYLFHRVVYNLVLKSISCI